MSILLRCHPACPVMNKNKTHANESMACGSGAALVISFLFYQSGVAVFVFLQTSLFQVPHHVRAPDAPTTPPFA